MICHLILKYQLQLLSPSLTRLYTLYSSPKSFYPIVLFNTTSKLFEKMIGEILQFLLISNNFIHSCQLGKLKHRSTTDVGIALTHFIQSEWVKNLTISMLAFDITQFFPLLNHWLLSLILDKAGFDHKVLSFFKNYLVSGKTKYLWNSFSSSFVMLTLVSVKNLLVPPSF